MIFGLFKKNKPTNEIDTGWLDEVFELLGEDKMKEISAFYNLFFLQLKTNVFTLLAPVDLKDDVQLHKFYTHKFSLGYVYGLIFAFLQSSDYMKKNSDKLHKILTIAMMNQLFNFDEKEAREIFEKARTTYNKDQIFIKGIQAGGYEWIDFYKSDCKGLMGLHFDQIGREIFKNDF